jgi:predicted Zn-dependent protease with MMP-like domain
MASEGEKAEVLRLKMKMDSQDFDQLVQRAYQKVPVYFREQLENVEITVEDSPGKNYRERAEVLLGLFEGVPKTAWYSSSVGVQPCKITLYQNNILASVTSWSELDKLILEVLMHEIAHYFGYNDKQMIFMDARLRKKLNNDQVKD